MAGITLAQAQEKLDAYLAAEEAILTGNQSYTILGRTMTRADLRAIQDGIKIWQTRVERLSRGSVRVRGLSPAD